MRRYQIISEIRDDIKRIQKCVLDADDGYAEPLWVELKAAIKHLADQCDGLRKERKERDREEAKERRALEREQAKGL